MSTTDRRDDNMEYEGSERVTYFAVLRGGRPLEYPISIARRIHTESVATDQILTRDFTWRSTDVIERPRRGPTGTTTLVEISAAAARAHMDRWRNAVAENTNRQGDPEN